MFLYQGLTLLWEQAALGGLNLEGRGREGSVVYEATQLNEPRMGCLMPQLDHPSYPVDQSYPLPHHTKSTVKGNRMG